MSAHCPLKLTISIKEAAKKDAHHVGKLELAIEFRAGETDLTTSFSQSNCVDLRSADTAAYVAAHCWLTDLQRRGLTFKGTELSKVISNPVTSTVEFETEWQLPGKLVTKTVTFKNSAPSLVDARQEAIAQWVSDLNRAFAHLDKLKVDFDVSLMATISSLIEKYAPQSPTQPWYARAERVCNEVKPFL